MTHEAPAPSRTERGTQRRLTRRTRHIVELSGQQPVSKHALHGTRHHIVHRSWGLPIVIAAFAALAVVVMGATISETGPWYRHLVQPRWAPPEAVFGVAWTAIYLFTGLAAVTGWRAMPDRPGAEWIIGLFALSGFLNVLWSLLFFRLHRPDWAVIELVALWVSIAAWIYVVWPRSIAAGLLLLPYLGWVTFAGYLTMTIVRLNGPFG